jgi:hypothetical protein
MRRAAEQIAVRAFSEATAPSRPTRKKSGIGSAEKIAPAVAG